MREYSIQDFTIVSTECDMLLFFCSDYQRVVTETINKLLAEYESNNNYDYSKSNNKLNLICHKSMIELRDNKNNIYLWDLLGDYDNTEDNDSFTLGYLTRA